MRRPKLPNDIADFIALSAAGMVTMAQTEISDLGLAGGSVYALSIGYAGTVLLRKHRDSRATAARRLEGTTSVQPLDDPFMRVICDFYWSLVSGPLRELPVEAGTIIELRNFLDDERGSLPESLVKFFSDLGFCLPGISEDGKHKWIYDNGGPSTLRHTPAERAVRQLHWDLVMDGKWIAGPAGSEAPSLRCVGATESVLAWFANMGMGTTVHHRSTHAPVPVF